jgi:hypothetical protein
MFNFFTFLHISATLATIMTCTVSVLALIGLITIVKWIISAAYNAGRRKGSKASSYSEWEKKRNREIKKKGSHL